MSEDFDDITDGSISIDRAKHHCGRLAVDCGWRAMEVETHIDAQAKIIAVLRAEVKAWRKCADIDPNDFAEEPLLLQHAVNMRSATDAAGALEDK